MATTIDISIDQGASYVAITSATVLTNPALPYDASTNPRVPLDLTGYTARMMVRKDYDSNYAEISLTDVSGLTLGGAAGTITIEITPTQTDAIRFTGDSIDCVYDLEVVNGSTVTRVQQGTFTVSRNITR